MITFFENADWIVNEAGIELKNKSYKVDTVTWDEINSFYNLDVSTIRPFYIEPFPFRIAHLEQEWLNKETYSEAFTFALGRLSLKAWNKKAAQTYNILNPNA
jgi:hypothetical protein